MIACILHKWQLDRIALHSSFGSWVPYTTLLYPESGVFCCSWNQQLTPQPPVKNMEQKFSEHFGLRHPRSKFSLKGFCIVGCTCLFGLILVLASSRPIAKSFVYSFNNKMIQWAQPSGQSMDEAPDSVSLSARRGESDDNGPGLDEVNGNRSAPGPAASERTPDTEGKDGADSKDSDSEDVLHRKHDEGDTQLLLEGENRPNSTLQDGCDLFTGQWVPDPLGPLYAYNSCVALSQAQNCRDNGRPDNNYEYFKWKPHGCEIPRLDPIPFLKLMEGKTMAFVGDSLARNQYESLLCILLQVEAANHTKEGKKRSTQRWYFQTHNFTLIRIWSSFLVRSSEESFSFAPEDSIKVFMDELDSFGQLMPAFDVVIISSGHWWTKKSVYIVGGKIHGGYKWDANVTEIDHRRAFSMALETTLKLIAEIPNYNGLTILKTFSPDHYQGGVWDTGGSCTGKSEPYALGQARQNVFSDLMRKKQLDALEVVAQRLKNSTKRNGSKYIVLDIFEVLNYRGDGHPGPYRSKDPNKQTQTDENGHPPPQDCLHWCMPGPVDTVNQLLFEMLRRQLPHR